MSTLNMKPDSKNDLNNVLDEEATYVANVKEIAPDLFKIVDKALALEDKKDDSKK